MIAEFALVVYLLVGFGLLFWMAGYAWWMVFRDLIEWVKEFRERR